ncbi:hypothetical protein [Devosia sp.]|uniref:hypothetical protein n=1 Tax=Devosia sp. TaxID=1871048 RepID=UPI0032677AD8
MSDQPLLFHCVCGQQGEAPEADEHRWAQIVGYAGHSSVRWHDNAEAAEADEPPIYLLETAPEAGREYWLRLDMPFAHQIGETFWCLYEAPNLHFNGLINLPEEIGSMRLVACKLLGWERHGEKCVVGNVSVREVVTLEQLQKRPAFPVIEAEVVRDFEYGRRIVERFGGFLILDQNVESDGGAWAVLTDTSEPELLLFAVWGSHADYVWAGRGTLSPELSARLAAAIAKAG